ncbi:dockerin type I domain-containing protein [Gloeobacter kilaueensis]|uniref:Dockerin domain-containing protein n=1 Tax=Gloeobacter kilaueensis (strain ATCC BAA-2537 / CCAP 1431/1 / ULC 316 / JS1) TaxID=1183438 RepID=U5QFC3_GLOK1|nr:dockerin type I domain-containing protein [Gloeobacter kilaueensis]AGY57641.1 hypothetical protein GKIL_1395 [Gloeobacter kilaueensis JS1]
MLRVASLVGLTVVVTLAVPAWAESGDINGDGRVDKRDIELIDGYLSGTQLLQDDQIAAADADRDGKITQNDRDLLQRRISGLAVRPATADPPRGRSAARTKTAAVPGRAAIDLTSADTGVVVDKATGEPLAGVEVALPDEGITVRTDSQGRFQLPRSSAGKILTARATDYAPAAVAGGSSGGYQLQLERLSPRLTVLDDNLIHLGDNSFGPGSANYAEFRLPARGRSYVRTFNLARVPQRDMILRIGSVIGLDTPESVAAGQSQLPLYGAPSEGLRISLNGQTIKQVLLNGDNIAVLVPRWLLQAGSNELRLETHAIGGSGSRTIISSRRGIGLGGLLGGLFGLGGDMGYPMDNTPDYDDLEFAHLVLEDPSGGN